jgi:CRISPR-associated protein Csd1
MILQALCGYYDRFAETNGSKIAQPGYELNSVTCCIVLDKEGNLCDVIDMIDEFEVTGSKGKRQKKRQPRKIITPQQPKRAGSRPEPAFLCENASFIFGVYKDRAGAEYRFKASKDIHERVLTGLDDEGAQAVLAFYNNRKQGTYLYEGVDTSYFEDGGNIVFLLDGESDFIHNRPKIQAAWNRHLALRSTEASIGQCLVTGEVLPIARIHGNLGGFGQDKPTVVGFNQDSFVSYRKEKGDNAPISENAAFKYVTALNMLISDRNHCMHMHGDKLLFWAEREAPLEEQAMIGLMEGGTSQPDKMLDEVKSREIDSILDSIYKGKAPEELGLDPHVKFYLLGLSSNKTRAVIRYFYVNTFGQLVTRLQLHYQDIHIAGPAWEPEHPSINKILIETAVLHKSENVPAPHRSALIRSVLSGELYPNSLYMAMLGRIRAEAAANAKVAINRTRIGVIKGYMNRLSRKSNNKEEAITVGLNKEDKTISYLLGQIFALLEKAQSDALGNVNASVVDKYLNAALASPQQVFPSLLLNAEKHFSKSKRYNIKMRIREIMEDIPSNGYPKTLNAEDQGKFLVGYYHQQQDLYTKKDKLDLKTVDETSKESDQNHEEAI